MGFYIGDTVVLKNNIMVGVDVPQGISGSFEILDKAGFSSRTQKLAALMPDLNNQTMYLLGNGPNKLIAWARFGESFNGISRAHPDLKRLNW